MEEIFEFYCTGISSITARSKNIFLLRLENPSGFENIPRFKQIIEENMSLRSQIIDLENQLKEVKNV